MQIPVMNHHQGGLMGELLGEFNVRDFDDESSVEQNLAEVGEPGGVSGSSRGNGGAMRERPVKVIPCPRCQSMNTKFCYYNNYSVNQPRHFCRNCQRYWTVGGTLRNVPVGGGSRKKTRTRGSRNNDPLQSPPPAAAAANSSSDLLMQQLSMLPPMGFVPATSQLPFLPGFGMLPSQTTSPISGLQEVPDLQTFYDMPQVPQLLPGPMLPNPGFFLPDAHSDTLASVMAKASLWSAAPQPDAMTGGRTPWEERPLGAPLSHLSGYEQPPIGSTPMNSKLAPVHAGFWANAVMDDRRVPHTPNSRNISPKSCTTDEERCPPSHCFGYHEDVVSQPWVGLQASDILQF